MNRREFLKLLSLMSLGSVLRLPAAAVESGKGLDTQLRQNVLILVLDAFSAEHASLYGYPRPTTPNLERLAQRSTVYHQHNSAGSFTPPGTASLLTGTYPWTHRAFRFLGTTEEIFETQNAFRLFQEHGYNTIAYTHNSLVSFLLHQFSDSLYTLKPTSDLCLYDQELSARFFPNDFEVAYSGEWLAMREHVGWKTEHAPASSLYGSLLDRMIQRYVKGRLPMKGRAQNFPRGIQSLFGHHFVLEDAIDWMRDEVPLWPKPFFTYIHVIPPHAPYSPRSEFVGAFDDGWAPEPKPEHRFSKHYSPAQLNEVRLEYDEHVAYTDAEVGRLLDAFERDGVLDNTTLVVTSDHGEMFERGIVGHVTESLANSICQVPLLIARPGQTSRVDVLKPTSSVDLLPTLLSATGTPVPDWCEGQVLPGFSGAPAPNERDVWVVDARANAKNSALIKGSVALLRDGHKLVRYFGHEPFEDWYELYDREADPEERKDLYSDGPERAARLRQRLDEKLREINSPYRRTS